MSAYSDLTAEFDYKDLITWINLDKLGENDNYFYDILIDGTGTTQITRSLGAVGTPGYSFIGDTDTGAYASAANNYDIATGGVQRLNVTSAGLDIKQQLTVTGASRFRATRNTNQAAANNVYTTIIYATEDNDNLSEYNNATGEFTATVAGTYLIGAGAISESIAWDATEVWQIGIFINGVQKNIGSVDSKSAAVTTNSTSKVEDVLVLAASDVVTARIYHNQGASINVSGSALYNYFFAHRIS